jgi:SAM-dependent methyltransferase
LVEQQIFNTLALTGKAVAQLSCNNGRELINCKEAGAGRCVGFDISDEFINQGHQLAAAVAGVPVEFVGTSVYGIPEHLDSTFDIVYVTVGALGWLPDLRAYFEIVARLLKDGGHLFIYEMYPVLNMFDAKTELEVKHSYFRTEPYVEETGPDYMDPYQTVTAMSYWFHHKLSDVITDCLESGLSLTHFEEYSHDISNVYKAFQDLDLKPPLSYALVAKKAAN